MKNRISSLIIVSIVLLLILGVGLQGPGQVQAAPEIEPGEDAGTPGALDPDQDLDPGEDADSPLLAALAAPVYTDTIEVDKTAERVTGCRVYEVALEITGDPQPAPMDVILVLDKSGSMFREIPGSSPKKTPMDYLKTAAKNFAGNILEANPLNRVAVVWFHGPDEFGKRGKLQDATLTRGFTSTLSQVNSAIDGVQEGYGTNIQAGFQVAGSHMSKDGRDNASRAIVLMTDGVANASIGNITSQGQNDPTSHNVHTRAAIEAGESCWDIKGSTGVFTIGLFNAITNTQTREVAKDTLEKAQNSGYYSSHAPENLTSIYNSILEELDYAATNAVVTDKIPTNIFEFVVDSEEITQGSVTYEDGIITWSAGAIGKRAVLKYKIKAKEDYLGGDNVGTNVEAILNYKDLDNNNQTKDFPVPTVDVPAPLKADAGEDRNLALGGSTILGGTPVATGGTGPYIYQWSSSTGGWTSTEERPSVSPAVDTEYTVTVADAWGCVNSDKVKITVLKGALVVNKIVEKGSTTRKFAIYVEGKGHTWTMLLAHGESGMIGDLKPGTYTIREVVPMDYKLVSISQSTVTIDQDNPNAEVTITNKKVNKRWFRHRKQKINRFTVKWWN